ncbi:MAG: PQQ-binding-like beta-propeller repeat protein [Desulfobacteraceae bacterium]|nr:PQQ-binding-like beta-propeller repeat protein [Desulfobacteraceae bacterium]
MHSQKPSAVFLSDLHIGENLGGVTDVLNFQDKDSYVELQKGVYMRKEFNIFLEKLKEKYGVAPENRIKYLILMGDIWDLAVQSMQHTVNLSLAFFDNVKVGDYFEEIIYIAGNHDHHLWRQYQTQNYLLKPINDIASDTGDAGVVEEKGVPPFPQVIAGFLDLTTPDPTLKIEGGDQSSAGNKFFTGLTGKARIPVNVVYPNLYITYKNDKGEKENILATHGHLFDPGWNLVTDYIGKFLTEEMGLKLDLKKLEMLNSPVTEFWNFSLAQMGAYNLIEPIYDNMLENKDPSVLLPLVKMLKTTLLNDLKAADVSWFAKKYVEIGNYFGADKLYQYIKDMKKSALPGIFYDQDFIAGQMERVLDYFKYSQENVASSLDNISKMIYGHTHIPLMDYEVNFAAEGKDPIVKTFYNTGGWVDISNAGKPMPITIFNDGSFEPIEIASDIPVAFFGAKSTLNALNVHLGAVGTQLWQWKPDKAGEMAVLYDKELKMLFVSVDGDTYALDVLKEADDKKVIWNNVMQETGAGAPHLLRTGDSLYVALNNQIIALDPRTGKKIVEWKGSPEGYFDNEIVHLVETPDNNIIAAVNGGAYCLDQNLKQLWEADLAKAGGQLLDSSGRGEVNLVGAWNADTGKGASSGILFCGFGSKVIAIDTSADGKGKVLWGWLASNGSGNVAMDYDPDNNDLFVSVEGYTYSLDAGTGKEKWLNKLPGTGSGTPHLLRAGDYLYSAFKGQISTLNPLTGKTEPSIKQWNAPKGSGEVVLKKTNDNRIIAGVGGYVYGLSLELKNPYVRNAGKTQVSTLLAKGLQLGDAPMCLSIDYVDLPL